MNAAPHDTDTHDVDARGLRCPWPLLRLARAVRMAGDGGYRLISDDPQTAIDLPGLAAERGWGLREVDVGTWFISVHN